MHAGGDIRGVAANAIDGIIDGRPGPPVGRWKGATISDAVDVSDDLAEAEGAGDGDRPTSFLPPPTFPAAMLADAATWNPPPGTS